MIKNGFLLCADCQKKIQPIGKHDTIVSTVYCSKCKTYFKLIIADGEQIKMERSVTS